MYQKASLLRDFAFKNKKKDHNKMEFLGKTALIISCSAAFGGAAAGLEYVRQDTPALQDRYHMTQVDADQLRGDMAKRMGYFGSLLGIFLAGYFIRKDEKQDEKNSGCKGKCGDSCSCSPAPK